MKKPKQDLFGEVTKDPRGWTELDGLRREYASVERRILRGEYDTSDLEKLSQISQEIIKREKEAREAWAKSFGK